MQFNHVALYCWCIASYCFAISSHPLSDITVQMPMHFIHPCMTRAPTYKFHVTLEYELVLELCTELRTILDKISMHVYNIHLYIPVSIYCGVLLHNDLLECNLL